MLSENELYKQIRVQNNRASDREKKVGTRVLHSHPSRMVLYIWLELCVILGTKVVTVNDKEDEMKKLK